MYTFHFASTQPFKLDPALAALGTHVSEDVAAWHAVVNVSEEAGKAFIANYHGPVQHLGTTVIFG